MPRRKTMKKATITEYSENFRMGCGSRDNWYETVPEKAAEDNAVRIQGHFEYAEAAVAVRDGRIIAVSVAEDCTWWDDADSTEFVVPEEDEIIHIIGWRTTSSEATWIRSPRCHNLNSKDLRAIGAWSDALDLEREFGLFGPNPELKKMLGNIKQVANQAAQLIGRFGPDFQGFPWYDHARIVREWFEDNGLA